MGSKRDISDYALIGDRHTAALVSSDASIDWLCLPHFASPACFAALLGSEENGRWRLAPREPDFRTSRRYRPDTMILETTFETEDGSARVVDFMAVDAAGRTLTRFVEGLSGRVPFRMDLTIRFDYGRLVPWVSRDDGTLKAVAGPHRLTLTTPVDCRGSGQSTAAEFEVREGQSVSFTLAHSNSFEAPPPHADPLAALDKTEKYWKGWARKCTVRGPWRDIVVRSLLTLKALTYEPTGGIIAAPTTSVPEKEGGSRNWDYRYCWLRDATFTLLSLMEAGYREEADEWQQWLKRAIAGNASQMQPLYSIFGDNRLEEMEVPWLDGFNGARPVRVGNAAFGQLQLDNFGEVLDVMQHTRRNHLDTEDTAWPLQKALLEHLETVHDMPDRGIWETRGPKRQFTHSRVMNWVAFDRAVKGVEEYGLDGPVERWRSLRDRIHDEVCTKGFSKKLGAFVQAYDNEVLDASALLFAQVGFLPADDPRIVSTVEQIQKNLTEDGFVLRYDTERSDDGMSPGEGVFLACSFWLADNLILQGRRKEAEALFERLLSLPNDVGLLAEEYDVKERRQIGNFPQGLSHLALISTALNLSSEPGPAHNRSDGKGKEPQPPYPSNV